MQKMTHEPMRVPQVPDGGGAQDDGLDLMRIFAVARRRWPVLLLGLLAGLLLGIAYAATATPVYTASAHISVGSADAENARELSGVSGVRLDEDQITTEIQVLRSEQIAARVVTALDLVQDPAFLSEPRTGPGRAAEGVKALLRLAAAAAVSWVQDEPPAIPLTPQELAEAARQDAVSLLRDNVSVRQVQRSRVLQITYTSVSPALSARIANAVANAYIEDQLASKYEATQRATNWLKERSDQLRLQSGLLDKAVDSFRRENNLAGAGGDLSSDIELELLNKQVADLRAELLALQARSNRLHEIVAQNDTSAFVSSTASQSITANLRSQYLETLRDFNYLRSSLGADHAQTRRRQRELIQLEGLMFEEIKRSEVVARNDVHEARERLASLEAAQTAAAAQLGADNTTLVELREMERNAGTVRSLYTSFLQRYQQSLQEQSFPVSDARILNPARVPQYPSSPQLAKVTALAGILGVLLAAGWSAVREAVDTRLRTEDQIRDILGLEFLGGLEKISAPQPPPEAADVQLGRREVLFPAIMRYGADKPLSGFAETLRTGRMSLTLKAPQRGASQIIGVVSCFPGEGKTITAANFAALLAAQGASVMLIDGDLRNPGLTRSLAGGIEQGLADVLLDGADWQDVLCIEQATGAHILPNRPGRAVHTGELLGGPAMEHLLSTCAAVYDCVILDLPPLGPVVDGRAVLHNLDGLFFVAKWGAADVNHAAAILGSDPRLRGKCYGAFLNMFDAKKAAAYGSCEGSSYGCGRAYGRYYDDS